MSLEAICSFMEKKIIDNISMMLLGIFINTILGHLIILFKIPFLFMDSVGTILIAVVLGPIYGSIVGIATNFLLSMTIEYVNLHFAIVNVVIGITAGVIAKKYDFSNIKVSIISGIVIGIISSMVAIPISIILAKGVTNKPIDNFVQVLNNSGKSLLISITISTISSSMLDKILSSLLVSISIKSIPFLNKKNNHK